MDRKNNAKRRGKMRQNVATHITESLKIFWQTKPAYNSKWEKDTKK